jgi:hypothetical protein
VKSVAVTAYIPPINAADAGVPEGSYVPLPVEFIPVANPFPLAVADIGVELARTTDGVTPLEPVSHVVNTVIPPVTLGTAISL